jgi:hypothetical protein
MTFLKCAAVCLIALMATTVLSAQQNFPLRSGEWDATVPNPEASKPPMHLLYCLNNETWDRALVHNPTCSIQQLSISLTGLSYSMDCPTKSFQLKGKVNVSFDGLTHMISKTSIDTIVNGKTTHADSQVDYRWKAAACDPNADMNLKFKQH